MSPEPNDGQTTKDPSIVVASTGQPFKTAAATKTALINKGLNPDDYDIVPAEGGSGFVAVSKAGNPPAAPDSMPNGAEAGTDRIQHEQDGSRSVAKSVTTVTRTAEKVKWVKFHARATPNDTERVELGVNGDFITVARQVPVPMPERFLEAADHTLHPVYHQDPTKDRLVETWVQTYQYDVISDGTWYEYDRFRREGSAVSRQAPGSAAR